MKAIPLISLVLDNHIFHHAQFVNKLTLNFGLWFSSSKLFSWRRMLRLISWEVRWNTNVLIFVTKILICLPWITLFFVICSSCVCTFADMIIGVVLNVGSSSFKYNPWAYNLPRSSLNNMIVSLAWMATTIPRKSGHTPLRTWTTRSNKSQGFHTNIFR